MNNTLINYCIELNAFAQRVNDNTNVNNNANPTTDEPNLRQPTSC